ncbi:MAG: hypothetical protein PHT51_03740 [Patescibacteria group bacterium]|nr:hypothetical protein [Patescibacteria group bacterium]MDD4611294.1 hypothetical protein [Patescibacteria group bacterium]
MTKYEVEKILKQIKPATIPNGTLELVSLSDNEIKLKATGLSQDVYKVQGKIIKFEDEMKNKIADQLKANFNDVKVSFV